MLRLRSSKCLSIAILSFRRNLSEFSGLGKREFWKKRYDASELTRFDWLLDAQKVTTHMLPLLRDIHTKSCEVRLNVLELGCGTSEVSSLLLETSGVPIKIFCVDYAVGSLKWQQELLSNTKPANVLSNYWLVLADACHLPFPDQFFHAIIDKGTCDSLLKLREDDKFTANTMLREVWRARHPMGKFVQITDEDPELRQSLLENALGNSYVTKLSWKVISESPEYFMYTVESAGG